MTIGEMLTLIQQGGPTALLVAMIVMLLRGTIITDGQYKAMLDEKQRQITDAARREDEWRTLALTGTHLAERALAVTPPARKASP